MDVDLFLSPDEISIIKNAESNHADWLADFVRKNADNENPSHVIEFEIEREHVLTQMKEWWEEGKWKYFYSLIQIETDFLPKIKDDVLNQFITELLVDQKDALLKAQNYYEMAMDQYYEGDISFYTQMEYEPSDATWSLFTLAKNLAPTNVEIRYHFIGMLRQGGGNPGKLLNEIKELLQIPPINATVFEKSKPLAYHCLEEFYVDAKKILQDYLKTNPQNDNSSNGLEFLAIRIRQRIDNKLVGSEDDRRMGRIQEHLATAFDDMSDFLGSIQSLEYYEQGNKLYRAGNVEDAVVALKKSIELSPNFAESHYLLGKLYSNLSLFFEAIKEFAIAKSLQPSIAKYHFSLGNAYLSQHCHQEALLEFETTLILNPFFEEAKSQVSEIKSITSDFAVAKPVNGWTTFQGSQARIGVSEIILNPPLIKAWEYELENQVVETSPVVDHGIVYIATRNLNGSSGSFIAIESNSGDLLWKIEVNSQTLTTPTIGNGMVYIRSENNILCAIDAMSGIKRWEFEHERNLAPQDQASLLLSGNVLCMCADKLYLVDALSGKGIGEEKSEKGNWGASPALYEGILYYGIEDRFMAYDLKSQKQLWQKNNPFSGESTVGPVIADDIVYTGSYMFLRAMNVNDGSDIWMVKMPSDPQGDINKFLKSYPVISRGRVYIGAPNGKLYCIDSRTGKSIWSFNIGTYITTSPIASGDIVYILSSKGVLYAFNALNGEKIWEYASLFELQNSRSAPAICDGKLFIAWDKVYAFSN